MEYTLAFTALLNGMPGFAETEAGKGDAMVSQLVIAWRNRKVQGITFADFSSQWIRDHS
jgi:hypothetical protein